MAGMEMWSVGEQEHSLPHIIQQNPSSITAKQPQLTGYNAGLVILAEQDGITGSNSAQEGLSEVRNWWEGKLSFRNFPTWFKFALAPAVVSVLAYSQFCISSLHANAVSSVTTEPELLFPRFCPGGAPAQPKWCGCYCSRWLDWKHHSQVWLRGDLAQD